MSVITETRHTGEFLVAELPGGMSRAAGTLNAGQNCQAGTVVGQLLTAGAPTAVGTPSGTGTITIAAAIGPNTIPGTYRLRCVAASSGAGTFHQIDPTGRQVRMNTATGAITVGGGATTSDHLGVTIADGTPDFAAGDEWTVEVAAGDYEILDPAEDDGAQIPAGILYGDTNATDADTRAVFIVRFATVVPEALVWPAGITNPQKTAALNKLASAVILTR